MNVTFTMSTSGKPGLVNQFVLRDESNHNHEVRIIELGVEVHLTLRDDRSILRWCMRATTLRSGRRTQPILQVIRSSFPMPRILQRNCNSSTDLIQLPSRTASIATATLAGRQRK